MNAPDNMVLPPDADKKLDTWGWGFLTGIMAGVVLTLLGLSAFLEPLK